jgi:hypothetical protein
MWGFEHAAVMPQVPSSEELPSEQATSQFQHEVGRMDSYIHLGLPALFCLRARGHRQSPRPPADGSLGRARIVYSVEELAQAVGGDLF